MILDYLGSKDIAKLRLATPVFRQLPTVLFRTLLLENMPWLSEVKDLDVANINWYDCCCALKSGLRNRRRIWRDVEELIGRIQSLQESRNDWRRRSRIVGRIFEMEVANNERIQRMPMPTL